MYRRRVITPHNRDMSAVLSRTDCVGNTIRYGRSGRYRYEYTRLPVIIT